MRSGCSTAMRAAGARCRSRRRAIIGQAERRRPARRPEATTYFQRAAAYPELFYGQLALERLGRPVPAPAGMPTMLVTDAQRAAFAQRRLVRATRRLERAAARNRPCSSARCPKIWTAMPIACLRPNWRPRSGGRTWRCGPLGRRATADRAFYMRPAFPTISANVPSGRAVVADPWHHPPGKLVRPQSRSAAPARAG